jgi:hypothetical protein
VKFAINELTPEQLAGVNKRVIIDAHRRDPSR